MIGGGVTALLCTVLHTAMVLGMIYIFFGPSYAAAQGLDTTQLLIALIGLVFTNGLLEACVATVVIVPLVKVLEPMAQKMGLTHMNIKLNKVER